MDGSPFVRRARRPFVGYKAAISWNADFIGRIHSKPSNDNYVALLLGLKVLPRLDVETRTGNLLPGLYVSHSSFVLFSGNRVSWALWLS